MDLSFSVYHSFTNFRVGLTTKALKKPLSRKLGGIHLHHERMP